MKKESIKNKEITLHPNRLIETPLFKTNTQLKMFSKLLTSIRKDKTSDTYSFLIKDIIKDFSYSKKSYSFLKTECKNMYNPYDYSDKNNKGFLIEGLFTKIDTATDNRVIYFKINPDIKPLLIELSEGYTSYYIENILHLETSNSTRIYQLLKQYEKIGKRTISILDLKYYLRIDEKLYPLFGNLKQKILLPSQKELKEKTDIKFTFKGVKKSGRKITHIEFTILKNNHSKADKKIGLKPEIEFLHDRLVGCGVSGSVARGLCENLPVELIKNNIRYVEVQIKKGHKIPNKGGHLVKAIKNNFYDQTELSAKDEVEEKRLHSEQLKAEEKVKEAKKEEEKKQKISTRNKAIDAFISNAEDEMLIKINTDFLDENKNHLMLKKFLKGGLDLDDSIVKYAYYDFIYKNNSLNSG